MTTKIFAGSIVAIVLVLASHAARAAPCVGFTDVEDTSAFCPNVEWIKNRMITLGCSSSTAFCPNDAVRRDAMAAFLQRLGNTLSPQVESQITIPVSFFALPPTQTIACSGPRNFPVSWSQVARGQAVIAAYGDTGPADFYGRLVESTDEGATWNDVSPMHAATAADGLDSRVSIHMVLPPRIIPPGQRYTYGVAIGRVPGSATTSALRELGCTMKLTFENHNPATSPLDEDD
jgi:hypothetical protein